MDGAGVGWKILLCDGNGSLQTFANKLREGGRSLSKERVFEELQQLRIE
jgi:hypothetical protein